MCKHYNNGIIPIKDLLDDHFLIPTYQRGYRWTRSQVEDLLNDLKDFEENPSRLESDYYCLQPLVVKEDSDVYRLIDGQQRLTTIWLLLNCLDCPQKFELKYERSEELSIIKGLSFDNRFTYCALNKKNFNSKAIEEWNKYVENEWSKYRKTHESTNVEVYHIFSAWLFIQNWLLNNSLPENFTEHVRVIWHIVEDEIGTFQNLNSGKIPLTNAELIKALFLSTYGHQNTENQLRQKLIADEFDSIERQLRAKDFWYFLNGSGPQPTSCISFIFEILQELESTDVYTGQERRTYFHFRDMINSLGTANKVWERVTDIFHVLEGWYNNPEIYNLVGFLRAKNRSIKAIYEAFQKCSTIEEFKNHLIYRCLDSINWYEPGLAKSRDENFDACLNENFRYDNNYYRVWNLLLLINIATLNMVETEKQNHVRKISKFSFADFHNCEWQIEHISPQQAKVKEGMSIPHIENMPTVGTKIVDVKDNIFIENIDPYIAATNDSIMSLSNLTFLSNQINASIGNSHFAEKRDMVIQKQSEGFYLLPSTMMVFTKAYTNKDGHKVEEFEGKTNYWSDIDRKAYLGKIKDILTSPYFEQAQKELGDDIQFIESFTPAFSYTSSNEIFEKDTNKKYEALEQFTYTELTKKYDYIIIPKIQRDYAQGRRSESDVRAAKIRHKLIKDIFEMGGEGLDFQIIFGTQEFRNEIDADKTIKKTVFVPIDGQQRLTTLFLLDLYYKKLCSYNSERTEKNKISFIYETRRSASDFCVDVVNNEWVDFPKIGPKEAITKSTWFHRYWLEDPTVDSMLVMLEAIHAEAIKTQSFPIIDNIHFAFFNLGQERLSDTIYLKMNTRGKELTSFENLKAAIEKSFTNLSDEWKKNIDSKWLDAFWRKDYPTILPDMRIMRFIANSLFVKLCEFQILDEKTTLEDSIKNNTPQKGEENYEEKANVYNRLLVTQALLDVSEQKQPQYIDSQPFIDALKYIETDDNLNYLSSILDCYADSYDFQPYWGSINTQILDNNYTQRAVLYAVSLFIHYCKTNRDGYNEWMRFVWNIAEHDSVDFKQFIRTCKLFKRLAKMGGCTNILQTLCKPEATTFSNTNQFKEEIEKANVSNNTELYRLIKTAESHAFFHGTIRFLVGYESVNWDNFSQKVSNLEELISSKLEDRKTISLFIPYVDGSGLKTIFSKHTLSNEDSNLLNIFLSKEAKPYVEDFFLKKLPSDLTGFQKQLLVLAPTHSGFTIYNNWGKHKCVLTNYTRQSGYYAVNSFPLDDAIYYNLQSILRNEPFSPQIGDGFLKAKENGYLVGLEMDFIYKGIKFRYYNENHTIRLMGNDWGQKLYQDIEDSTFCCVNDNETKDSLVKKIDSIVEYSICSRFKHLKTVYEYLKELGCNPKAVGCNSGDSVDVSFELTLNEMNNYKCVSIEHQLEKCAIAFTINRNHRIEVGIRKSPEDAKKNKDVKLSKPKSHNSYSNGNDWWYYVYACQQFDINIVQEELRCLIQQYIEHAAS